MSKYGERLYRGISLQYRDAPFIPSALRPVSIFFMEKQINNCLLRRNKQLKLPDGKTSNQIEDFRDFCTNLYMISEYLSPPDIEPCICAFYSYFLSLVNCAIGLNINQIAKDFCTSNFFTKNKHNDNIGINGLDIDEIITECYTQAQDVSQTDPKKMNFIHLDCLLHDYAFFQHLNHVFSDLDNSGKIKSVFPTMCLDWTWDKSIITDYLKLKDPVIVSINFNVLKNYFPLFTKLNIHEQPKIYYTDAICGFTTHHGVNGNDFDKLDWDNWDNHLMREQDAAVIFWHWKYTIDELKSNPLGKALDFRLEV